MIQPVTAFRNRDRFGYYRLVPFNVEIVINDIRAILVEATNPSSKFRRKCPNSDYWVRRYTKALKMPIRDIIHYIGTLEDSYLTYDLYKDERDRYWLKVRTHYK